MKNAKYPYLVLSIVIVLMMSNTFNSVLAYSGFPDVPLDSPYAYEVGILKEAGIFLGDEKGNFNPNNVMTRAEAATLLVRVFLGDNVASSGRSSFKDVSTKHWASPYIEAAVSGGMINGYGDGRFGPGDALTYNQAVTLLIRCIGYEDIAQIYGGWPYGYIDLAEVLGVTENTIFLGDEPVRRSTVAVLVFNTLFARSQYNIDDLLYDGS